MPKVTVYRCAETIQGRKLFKGGNYSRAETIYGNTVSRFFIITNDSNLKLQCVGFITIFGLEPQGLSCELWKSMQFK